eukprot:TRINITY_DN7910_c0_g1_i1.p1 TRINITY_DN7910_c0_g1~~TRINITY_DN7910_c0_g1_i1.p1  ORF type:complete len:332 (-),score=72.91 TRINITY_DN7910_c0_g1_i1:139-1134(-)
MERLTSTKTLLYAFGIVLIIAAVAIFFTIQSKNKEIEQIRLELQMSNQARVEDSHENSQQISILQKQKDLLEARLKSEELKVVQLDSQSSAAAAEASYREVQLYNQLSHNQLNLNTCYIELTNVKSSLNTTTIQLNTTLLGFSKEKLIFEDELRQCQTQLNTTQSEIDTCHLALEKKTKTTHSQKQTPSKKESTSSEPSTEIPKNKDQQKISSDSEPKVQTQAPSILDSVPTKTVVPPPAKLPTPSKAPTNTTKTEKVQTNVQVDKVEEANQVTGKTAPVKGSQENLSPYEEYKKNREEKKKGKVSSGSREGKHRSGKKWRKANLPSIGLN